MPIDVEECFHKYSPMVYRRCLQLLRAEAMAMDATQDVFMKLITYQNRLDDRATFSLLYRIATNVSLNMIRDNKKYDSKVDEYHDDFILNKIAHVDQIEAGSAAESVLFRLFKRCPPSSKTIAVLYYYDGLTLEEVAQEVNMSVSGVRKRLNFLKAKLHEMEGTIE